MAVTDYRGFTTTNPQTGIQFTKVTDSSSDWSSVSNNTYFFDKTDQLVYFKNNEGIVINLFTIGLSYTRRHQTTTNYDYLGYATEGTSESSVGWILTRLTLDSSGVSSVMHASDSWDNRVTATYS